MIDRPDTAGATGGRAWRWLAWAWLVAVLALGVQQAMFWRAPAIDTDIMALLPGATEDARLAAANQRLSEAVTGDVVVLLSARDWNGTQAAARAFADTLARSNTLRPADGNDADALAKAIAFHAPHRQGLLTPAQRQWLQTATPDAIADMEADEGLVKGGDWTTPGDEGNYSYISIGARAREKVTRPFGIRCVRGPVMNLQPRLKAGPWGPAQ